MKERKFVIDPRKRWKLYWDIVCGIFIIYSVIVIPFRLFFRRETKEGSFSYILDWLIDFLFFMDMVFSFRTGYMHKNGQVVMNPKRIMQSYLRSWFVVDFFSTVPFDFIIYKAFDVPKAQLRTIKLVRILRLARLAKLAKLMSRGSLQLLLAAINPAVLRLVNLIVSILFVAHFLACFWAAVNICNYEEDKIPYDTNAPVHSGSIVSKCGNSNVYPLWFSQYLAAFYWVIATMMAVGYGDIYASNTAERMYAIFVEIVGAGCFGFIISTTTQIVETMSPETRIRKSELELILEYSKYRNLPRLLRRRLKKHFEYMYTQKSVFDELAVLRQLPVTVRVDLTLNVHDAKTEKLGYLLDSLDDHFVAEILLILRPFFMQVGETIRVNDVVPDQIYIVNIGHIQVLRPSGAQWVISGLMHDGSVIGMAAAMKNETINFMLCAPVATDMWFIETHEMKMVLDHYVEDTEKLMNTNEKLHAIEQDCWASETIEINGVKTKSLILVDRVPTDVHTVDDALLAGAAELAGERANLNKKKILVKTIRLDPNDPARKNTIESLEKADDIFARSIIDPQTKEKTIWDVSIGLLIIFSVAVVPLRIGFDLPPSKSWIIIDWITDASFTLDIIVTFRTAYLDDNNTLVTVPKWIMNRYLKFWFAIDLVSTVPIDKIVEKLTQAGGGLRSLKLIRIVRLVRLLKLAKLLKIDTSAVEEVIEVDQTVSKTAKLFGFLFGLAHFFGCFWNMSNDVDYLALGYSNVTEYEEEVGKEEGGLSHNYIQSLYWAFTTMTTVGYGDILPGDDGSRLYATIMMIMGATMFSYIVGSASSIVQNEKNGEKQVKERMLGLFNYCIDRGISKPLEKRLKRNLNFSLNQNTPFEEQYIMDCLPSHLRSELVMMVKKEALDKICIFSKGRNMSYVSCVMQYFQPCMFCRRDILYHPMVESRGIYFILKGRIGKVLSHEKKKRRRSVTEKNKKSTGDQQDGADGSGLISENKLIVVGLPFEEFDFIGFDRFGDEASDAGKIEDERKFGAMCLEDCQCYYLSSEAITLILLRHPSVADTLIQSIKEEGKAMHRRRKEKLEQMKESELRKLNLDNNDMETHATFLEKEGLLWGSQEAFDNFVVKQSKDVSNNNNEHDLGGVVRSAGDGRSSPDMTRQKGKGRGELGRNNGMSPTGGGALGATVSCNLVEIALRQKSGEQRDDCQHGSGGSAGSDGSRRQSIRNLSGGLVLEDDDDMLGSGRDMVVQATKNAARKIADLDPLLGRQSPHEISKSKVNPLLSRRGVVMKPPTSAGGVGGGGSSAGKEGDDSDIDKRITRGMSVSGLIVDMNKILRKSP